MKALVLILGVVLALLMLGKRKKAKSSDDDWKPNRNARAKQWDSAGNEVNPRRNLMRAAKGGGVVKVDKPYKD